MFAKSLRLPLGKTHIHGKTLSSLYLVLTISPNNNETNRYACLVTKKIDKRATVRNRLRRLVITSLQEYHTKLKQGYDLFFRVKALPEEKDIQEEVGRLLQESTLL